MKATEYKKSLCQIDMHWKKKELGDEKTRKWKEKENLF